MGVVPVLEIGGTHVAAALVDRDGWGVGPVHRADVDSAAPAAKLIDSFAEAGEGLAAGPGRHWAVAMPDPFDYVRGIGRFRGVGKFAALNGVNLRTELTRRLRAGKITFCNDADAFVAGEWVAGAASGHNRVVGLTLGTGVGSGWLDRGRVVDPGNPAGGRAHLLSVDGVPLEDVMSRRAIRREYALSSGDAHADVGAIADLARSGDAAATTVLASALRALGRALAPALRAFAPDVIVLGGSMAGSWQLFEPWFIDGLHPDSRSVTLRVATDRDGAGLRGAAYLANG